MLPSAKFTRIFLGGSGARNTSTVILFSAVPPAPVQVRTREFGDPYPIQPCQRDNAMASPITKSHPKIILLCRASHSGR